MYGVHCAIEIGNPKAIFFCTSSHRVCAHSEKCPSQLVEGERKKTNSVRGLIELEEGRCKENHRSSRKGRSVFIHLFPVGIANYYDKVRVTMTG